MRFILLVLVVSLATSWAAVILKTPHLGGVNPPISKDANPEDANQICNGTSQGSDDNSTVPTIKRRPSYMAHMQAIQAIMEKILCDHGKKDSQNETESLSTLPTPEVRAEILVTEAPTLPVKKTIVPVVTVRPPVKVPVATTARATPKSALVTTARLTRPPIVTLVKTGHGLFGDQDSIPYRSETIVVANMAAGLGKKGEGSYGKEDDVPGFPGSNEMRPNCGSYCTTPTKPRGPTTFTTTTRATKRPTRASLTTTVNTVVTTAAEVQFFSNDDLVPFPPPPTTAAATNGSTTIVTTIPPPPPTTNHSLKVQGHTPGKSLPAVRPKFS